LAALEKCSPETARCHDARNYAVELRPCCRKHIVRMSRDIAAIFEGAGVTYWLDYGTLLGAVRNPMTTWADYPWLPQDDRPSGPLAPGIVPHDKDADWGVLHDDWIPAVRALRRYARHYHVQLRQYSDAIKVHLSDSNSTNLDLFFWSSNPRKPEGLLRKRYAAVDRCKGREFDRADLLPLTTVEWEGMTLPAPKDPEVWLEFRYGPNWRTPIAANNDGVSR
jgi:hypothetical protein